jgi:ATP phosphoribosyltransferase
MLTLAVQKSGRLSEKTKELLKESGIFFENGSRNPLKSKASNFPLQILYLRDDDIPECVADGIADAGIVGENVVAEKERDVEIKEKLGFAKCRLSIAVPKNMDYTSRAKLNSLKIATSYPKVLQRFLEKNAITAEIHELNGSVEIAPGIGFADAIFDIVSTGSTLISNGLKEVETVLSSEAVLISNTDITEKKNFELERLIFRFKSVKKARNFKYILLNAPNNSITKISEILPGMKSPTVMPLAQSGWSSVHSVVREDDFWEVIENLRSAGAQGILVIPIEKMII